MEVAERLKRFPRGVRGSTQVLPLQPYRAAILALAHAGRLGATSVRLRTDSLLLVNQMGGQAAVKAKKLVGLNRKLHLEVERFGKGKVKIVRIDRNENRAADKLAQFARERSARRTWSTSMQTPRPVRHTRSHGLVSRTARGRPIQGECALHLARPVVES